nr:MAG TPA: hypothetical protein [Caudoviricetes sp.]
MCQGWVSLGVLRLRGEEVNRGRNSSLRHAIMGDSEANVSYYRVRSRIHFCLHPQVSGSLYKGDNFSS